MIIANFTLCALWERVHFGLNFYVVYVSVDGNPVFSQLIVLAQFNYIAFKGCKYYASSLQQSTAIKADYTTICVGLGGAMVWCVCSTEHANCKDLGLSPIYNQ